MFQRFLSKGKAPAAPPTAQVAALSLADAKNCDKTEEVGKGDNSFAKDETPAIARSGNIIGADGIFYEAIKMVGHGSFGAVFMVNVVDSTEVMAIKKVLIDRRFKNRELQVMKIIAASPHPFIISLHHSFITSEPKGNESFMNLVLDYVPETLHSVMRYYNRKKKRMPLMMVKIYMYQMARALAHIHGLGITHRDIKPQNLLVHPYQFVLKLCDFGSAKELVPGAPNVAYICSRYYRAPELIFGSTDYSSAIDMWSFGCVVAELFFGSPIFPGSSGVDQMIEVVKVLGTPSKDELKSMNPGYQEFKFPELRAKPINELFGADSPPEAMSLLGEVLKYIPKERPPAIKVCASPFFDNLRTSDAQLPNGEPIPASFSTFTPEELSLLPSGVDESKLLFKPAVADRSTTASQMSSYYDQFPSQVDYSNSNVSQRRDVSHDVSGSEGGEYYGRRK